VGGGGIQHKIHQDLILVTVLTTTLLDIAARGKLVVKCRLKQKCIFKEIPLLFSFGVDLPFLYSSPNIVRVIKSRRTRWAGHVARMDEERGCIGSWWGNRREGDHWGDLGVDGWI